VAAEEKDEVPWWCIVVRRERNKRETERERGAEAMGGTRADLLVRRKWLGVWV
jgi:hypothetical protein